MSQSLSKSTIHLVFSTKNRVPYLTDSVRDELHAYMARILKDDQSPALIINSVEDHVHILLSQHRTVALSHIVERLKKSSSKWLKTKPLMLQSFAWQSGYGAFSVSESNIPQVRGYIENQREHHQTKSFQDELRCFLEKHHIDYDERYLWD